MKRKVKTWCRKLISEVGNEDVDVEAIEYSDSTESSDDLPDASSTIDHWTVHHYTETRLSDTLEQFVEHVAEFTEESRTCRALFDAFTNV